MKDKTYKILHMCMPKYFDVKHHLMNIHMKMEKKVNLLQAKKQWFNFRDSLFLENNTVLSCFIPEKNLVDKVFCANAGLIYGNKFVTSNFSAEPRRPESKYYYNYFKNCGYKTMMPKKFYEGAGDSLFSHNSNFLWLGHGFRTEKESFPEIIDFLGLNKNNVFSLKLIDPRWYHLDTCFMPFDKDKVIIYRNAFDKESYYKILSVYKKENIYFIDEEDAEKFICNSVFLNNKLYIPSLPKENIQKELSMRNYKLKVIPYDQFMLAGGSLKCSVLEENKNYNLNI